MSGLRRDRRELVTTLKASELLGALSYALDVTEGQPMGHSMQTCLVGMRLAAEIGLEPERCAELYYVLLLKDAGCSSNASRLTVMLNADEIRAKGDAKDKDWTRVGLDGIRYAVRHAGAGRPVVERIRSLLAVALTNRLDSRVLVKIRCERGATIVRKMGFGAGVAAGVYSLDEQWNGMGHPKGLMGESIPLLARIANLAQTLVTFYGTHGAAAALGMMDERSGRWFDPDLVRAAHSVAAREELWRDLEDPFLALRVQEVEPREYTRMLGAASIDDACEAFAEIIDAKSPFTYRHSLGVAEASVTIARRMGLPAQDVTMIRRAALLHDIGKLSVPNVILEKPSALTTAEWGVVRRHPYYTFEVLRRIPGFGQLSEVAAAHHERLDGSGYWRHWDASRLSLEARILAVADTYDALSGHRPYRAGRTQDEVFGVLARESQRALDAECVEALSVAKGVLMMPNPAAESMGWRQLVHAV